MNKPTKIIAVFWAILFFINNHKVPADIRIKNPERNKSALYKDFLSALRASTKLGP